MFRHDGDVVNFLMLLLMSFRREVTTECPVEQASPFLVACDQVSIQKMLKRQSGAWYYVFSKSLISESKMTFVKVTAKELHEQCQYGLIKDYSVPFAESLQKFKQ